MKYFIPVFISLTLVFSLVSETTSAASANSTHTAGEWKLKPREPFTDAEANFKTAMDKILKEYVDKGLSREDLYRAASAGMLDSLNSGDHNWNTLLSPSDLAELQISLASKVTGIGVSLKFDEATGNGLILSIIPRSPSEKAGLKRDDTILSVDGKRFKGKPFRDLVMALRGKPGEKVDLKVLRDDRLLSLTVKRDVVTWAPVDMTSVDAKTALLRIDSFNVETPKLVEERIKEINAGPVKNLIIDVRSNAGGSFDAAVKTTELFVPKDRPIVVTKDREGKTKTETSTSGLLKKDLRVVLLTNGDTSSGAEFFTAALKEERGAKIVGLRTLGKWNAQMIETLPNGYAIKYTVKSFQSPLGRSYQDVGVSPDVEVALPKDVVYEQVLREGTMAKRLEVDPQLKAANQLFQ